MEDPSQEGSPIVPYSAHGQRHEAGPMIGIFPSGMVVTIEGERPIDTIYPGDILLILGNIGYSPVQRVTEIAVDVSRQAGATPILIRAGALDLRSPIRDTILAPRTLVGIDDRLIPVASLVNGRSIAPAPETGRVRYLQLEMLVHEMVIVDGVRVATQPCGQGLCRPLLDPGPALDGIRAGIAARIDRPRQAGDTGAAGLRPLPIRRLS